MISIEKLYNDWVDKKIKCDNYNPLNTKSSKLIFLDLKKEALYAEQKYIVVKGTLKRSENNLYVVRADELSREIKITLSIIKIIDKI